MGPRRRSVHDAGWEYRQVCSEAATPPPADSELIDVETWRQYEPSEFRILIADDLEDTRFVIRRALRRVGYEVHEATDGEELLEVARRVHPDLMIVDILMPRLDGLSALAEIRRDPELNRAYIILLTGKSSVDEKIEGFQLGADDYVTKPYSLGELKARVEAGIRLKAMHRSLLESQQILVRQEKMATVGLLAAGVAHEFNNIMSAISGYAQLARNDDRFVPRLIDIALDQSQRAQRITSSLTTFAGSSDVQVRATDPVELVDSALCLLEKELKRRAIALEVEAGDAKSAVRVDRGQMQQVLVHLLLNAVQAASGGGQGGRIEVRVSSAEGRALIEVDDDGPGIPESLRHRIFDPFYTTKGALGRSAEPGTGLGLTFSLNIVQSNRGELDLVPSRLGGACFRIALPAAEGPAPVAPAPEEPGASESQGLPHNVVLIEDDEDLQDVVREFLEPHPPAIFDAGRPALEHCREEPVDAIILDINIRGDLDGWQVLEELSRLPVPPPVITTTGSVTCPERASVDYPNLRMLPKPFRLAELEQALRGVARSEPPPPTAAH